MGKQPPPKYRGPTIQKGYGELTVRDVRLSSVNCEVINNYNVCYTTPHSGNPMLSFTMFTRFGLPRLQLRIVMKPAPHTKENMYACYSAPGELTLQREPCTRPEIPPGCYIAKGLYAPSGGLPQGDYLLKMRGWGTHEEKRKQLFTSIVKIHSIDFDNIGKTPQRGDPRESDSDDSYPPYMPFTEVD